MSRQRAALEGSVLAKIENSTVAAANAPNCKIRVKSDSGRTPNPSASAGLTAMTGAA